LIGWWRVSNHGSERAFKSRVIARTMTASDALFYKTNQQSRAFPYFFKANELSGGH
jgi:hypothetical protein